MSESDSKGGFWGAFEAVFTFPFALLLGGFAAAIWGASNGFHYKEIDLAAGDAWRLYVMFGGVVAMLGAVALYLIDKREDVPKAPLLYRLSGKYPYTIYEPRDREEIEVKEKDQKFSIVVTGSRGPPRGSVLRVMWRSGDKLHPVYDTGAEGPNLPGFAWRFTVYCPHPDKLKSDGDEREYALYYVGRHAEPLVKYRDILCTYFAKEGNPSWLPLPERNDIVRCSVIKTIIFKLPKIA